MTYNKFLPDNRLDGFFSKNAISTLFAISEHLLEFYIYVGMYFYTEPVPTL